MKDVALPAHRFDADEARQLIHKTKAGVKIKGYRGKPAFARASAVRALVGLSNLMADAGKSHRIDRRQPVFDQTASSASPSTA